MATVSAVVYDYHKKADGTYNVKIRVFHKKERKLIDTPHLDLFNPVKIKNKTYMKRQIVKPFISAMVLFATTISFSAFASCDTDNREEPIEVGNEDENENGNDMNEENKTTFDLNGVTFKMVTVEGGTFTMGSDERAKGGGTQVSNQKGEHQVTLSTYMIGETEVTRALWNEVMRGTHSNSDLNYPIASVTVADCLAFIKKLNEKAHEAGIIPTDKNFYLPTEAQWEFASKGGNESKGYTYSGSNNLSEVGWTSSDGSSVHPVKKKKPNELGIYDMSGNVYEWVADYAAPYTTEPKTDPCNTTPSNNHIKRGGSFYYNDPYRFTSTYRYFYSATDYTIGLRIVLY